MLRMFFQNIIAWLFFKRSEMENVADILGENLRTVREEIEQAAFLCGRKLEEVTVMAVTKTHPAEYIRAALKSGLVHIGENRVTEGGRKIREIGKENAVFHAIGVLHRKEVRQAARDFHRIDAVDSLAILSELGRRKVKLPVLLEVNTSGEPAKKGFAPEAGVLEEALNLAADNMVNVMGLLTVGPLTQDMSMRRRAFSLLRELRDISAASSGNALPELSMGMSDDFAEAILEGATTVRLGRRLFGSRKR
ncbi:YggS family pyridoxal phosphate-dependent enzyme [Candidatus Fermentibacteria bacterium]|nr:MAG: YggS family pyridoxal phosphate-dependent enzyme [Candidatus Fermentibacteria bacterium]